MGSSVDHVMKWADPIMTLAGGAAAGNPLMLAGGASGLLGAGMGSRPGASGLSALGTDLSLGVPGLFDPSSMGFKGLSRYLPQGVQGALGIGDPNAQPSGASAAPAATPKQTSGLNGWMGLLGPLAMAGATAMNRPPMQPPAAPPMPVAQPAPAPVVAPIAGAAKTPSPMSALAAYRQFLSSQG